MYVRNNAKAIKGGKKFHHSILIVSFSLKMPYIQSVISHKFALLEDFPS
jgi:hypothetical protein